MTRQTRAPLAVLVLICFFSIHVLVDYLSPPPRHLAAHVSAYSDPSMFRMRAYMSCVVSECRIIKTTTHPSFDIFLHEDRKTEQMEGNIARTGQYYETSLTECIGDIVSTRLGNDFGLRQTFWDVGANIGWYTLLASANGMAVVAIEAMQYNLRLLNASLELNAYKRTNLIDSLHNVNVFHRALVNNSKHALGKNVCVVPVNGNKDGWTTNFGNGHILLEAREERCAEWTYTTSIDNLLNIHTVSSHEDLLQMPIFIMKMDCEGCEVNALHGAENLLTKSSHQPCIIFAEYLHDPDMNVPENVRIINWMDSLDYDAFAFSDFQKAWSISRNENNSFRLDLTRLIRPGDEFGDVGEIVFVWRTTSERCSL